MCERESEVGKSVERGRGTKQQNLINILKRTVIICTLSTLRLRSLAVLRIYSRCDELLDIPVILQFGYCSSK